MFNRKKPVVLASSVLLLLLALLLTGCGIAVRSTNSEDPVNQQIDTAGTNDTGEADKNGATDGSSVDTPDSNDAGRTDEEGVTGEDDAKDEVESNDEKIYKDYDELILAYYKAINNVDADAMFVLFDDKFQSETQHMKDYVEERMEVMKNERDEWFGGDWYNRVTAGEPELFSDNIYCLEVTIDGEYCDYIYIQKEADGRYYINVETTQFWH
ncbi:MAG: hypothetical protein WAP56_09330 [Acetivibrionales bacterium]